MDNLSWVKGKHNFRFGGEFRWIISPQTFTQRVRGDYEWGFTSDYLNDFSPNPTLAATSASARPVTPFTTATRRRSTAYANDEWRISPTVTLNLGIALRVHGRAAGRHQLAAAERHFQRAGTDHLRRTDHAERPTSCRASVSRGRRVRNTSVHVGFAMANDVIYDNLGILSLPPQVQQTCDTVPSGHQRPTSRACTA